MKCDYRGKLMHDRKGDFYLCNEHHSNGECECLPTDCPYRTDITFKIKKEGLNMTCEDIDFYELVDKLFQPKHDGNPRTLCSVMLAEKLMYMTEHKFSSYEEEVQWMADYLKEHWNDKF